MASLTPFLRDLAQRQWDDYRHMTPGTIFAERDNFLSLDEAYTVQMEVARLRSATGDMVAGYKVGCIGPGVVEQFGMSGPIHGRLYRSEFRRSGDAIPHDAFANLAVEGEMAVRLGPNGSIEAAFPVIELHHFLFRGARKTLPELVANNGINGGIVLPDEGAARLLEAWPTNGELTLNINDRVIEAGALWPMEGGAVASVDWLAKDLARHGKTLLPGDIVLTGTPLGLYPVSPGDHVAVAVDGQVLVKCSIS